jgi:hypothetical protein
VLPHMLAGLTRWASGLTGFAKMFEGLAARLDASAQVFTQARAGTGKIVRRSHPRISQITQSGRRGLTLLRNPCNLRTRLLAEQSPRYGLLKLETK